jgi:glycosyltransferase involved in cell wall biosynthesis
MRSATKEDIALLKDSGVFDADWYRSAYPDVRSLRMDPAEHYLRYGQSMGRMSADGEQIDISILKKLKELPVPKKDRTLMEANEICLSETDTLGLAYARRHLPEEFFYTIEILRANASLRRGDEAAWLRHLNAYLANFDVAPVQLGEGDTLFDRLKNASLPAVIGGPLISVIMPTYNAEKSVNMAARSILNQTWRNLELLIVDDASEDGTWAKLQEISASDERVKIQQNKVNVGPYVSKNLALINAKGVWITGHDADDWAHPLRLEQHVSAAQMHHYPASHTFMLRMTSKGLQEHFSKVRTYSLDGAARKCAVSTLFKADFLRNKLGFWDSVRFGADSEIIARSRRILGSQFGELPFISMLCLEHSASLTNDPVNGIRTKTGLSPNRKAYKSAGLTWCADTSTDQFYISFPHEPRRFFAPHEMVVSPEVINLNINMLEAGE